jgi:hypothetical protein
MLIMAFSPAPRGAVHNSRLARPGDRPTLKGLPQAVNKQLKRLSIITGADPCFSFAWVGQQLGLLVCSLSRKADTGHRSSLVPNDFA